MAIIALEDLQASRELLKLEMCNHSARLCQQYIEKLFKDIIVRLGNDEKDMFLLSTHNIPKISFRVAELVGVEFSKEDISLFRELTDYYFDTNYPGGNYIRISRAEAQEVYAATIYFTEKLLLLLEECRLEEMAAYKLHQDFVGVEKLKLQQ